MGRPRQDRWSRPASRPGPARSWSAPMRELEPDAPVVRQLGRPGIPDQRHPRDQGRGGRQPGRDLPPRRSPGVRPLPPVLLPRPPQAPGLLPGQRQEAGRLHLPRRPDRRGRPPRGDPRPAPRRRGRHAALARRRPGRVFRGAKRTGAGVNAEHLVRLPADLAAGWTPDLARLESLKAVRQMSPRDYRESWAWVHYLLNDTRPHKAALLGYLADLRASPTPRRCRSGSERPKPSPARPPRPDPRAADRRARPPATRRSGSRAPGPSRRFRRSATSNAEPSSAPAKRGFLARVLGIFGS